MSRRTGVIVPSTFDMAEKLNALAPSSSSSRFDEVELAVGGEADPAQLDAALGRQDLPRHDVGVVLEQGEHHDVARRARLARPHDWTARLRPSVAFLMKMQLASDGALMKRCTFSRAISNASVASVASW